MGYSEADKVMSQFQQAQYLNDLAAIRSHVQSLPTLEGSVTGFGKFQQDQSRDAIIKEAITAVLQDGVTPHHDMDAIRDAAMAELTQMNSRPRSAASAGVGV